MVDELPCIMWALNTTKIRLRESLFSLVFDIEAALPLEIVFPTSQVESFDKEISEERLPAKLNLISEVRAEAHLQVLKCNKVVTKLYDRGVCHQWVELGDLVL